MKFTQHWAGDPPGRTDSGPDLRGLVWGGRKGEDCQETVLYYDVVGARKKRKLVRAGGWGRVLMPLQM